MLSLKPDVKVRTGEEVVVVVVTKVGLVQARMEIREARDVRAVVVRLVENIGCSRIEGTGTSRAFLFVLDLNAWSYPAV